MESTHITGACIWMGIFFIAAGLFWGVSVWAVIRGGKDALDIVARENKGDTTPKGASRTAD